MITIMGRSTGQTTLFPFSFRWWLWGACISLGIKFILPARVQAQEGQDLKVSLQEGSKEVTQPALGVDLRAAWSQVRSVPLSPLKSGPPHPKTILGFGMKASADN